jgi:hypothetical protein
MALSGCAIQPRSGRDAPADTPFPQLTPLLVTAVLEPRAPSPPLDWSVFREARGLVTRCTDRNDRRARIPVLTDEGSRVQAEVTRARDCVEADLG